MPKSEQQNELLKPALHRDNGVFFPYGENIIFYTKFEICHGI